MKKYNLILPDHTNTERIIDVKESTCTSHGSISGYCRFRNNRICPYHKSDGKCSVDCDLEGKGKVKTRYESFTEGFTFPELVEGAGVF
jgi:hypothetical protein